MSGTSGLRLAIALAAGPAIANSAEGQQGQIDVTPLAGGLIPTTSLAQLQIGGLTPTPFVFGGQMRTAGALGARLGYWVTDRWGVEATYFYSPSDFRITIGPFATTVDAQVQGGTLKAFYKATPQLTGTDILLSAGLTGVDHSGTAFQLARNQFDVGGVIGAGLRIEMSTTISLRFDGDLLIYRWSAGVPGLVTSTQADLLMTAGLAIRLAR